VSPRDTGELRDIVPSAFLHYGFDHLMANTIPPRRTAARPCPHAGRQIDRAGRRLAGVVEVAGTRPLVGATTGLG
ncbi:hypothetical protein ABZ945_06190, partial [Streptomyces sp. NPDC046887]